jgi:SAM-dependent methyltransferase
MSASQTELLDKWKRNLLHPGRKEGPPGLSPLAERMAKVKWVDNHIFESDGVRFYIDDKYGDEDTSLPTVVIAKTWNFFQCYEEELGYSPTRNILDVGIWKGGSALAFASLLAPKKLVAIDICDPIENFDTIRKNHKLGERISVYYNTSQDDQAKLDDIIAKEFDGPLDLIVDDASHDYHLTKRTLELTFRHLRPGGWYVVEDWAWSHAPGWDMWNHKPALTNMIFRLAIATYSRPDMFDRVIVRGPAVFIRKGDNPETNGVFDLDDCAPVFQRELKLF